jgi:hypothetical protein
MVLKDFIWETEMVLADLFRLFLMVLRDLFWGAKINFADSQPPLAK